jgi:hypothetical protein
MFLAVMGSGDVCCSYLNRLNNNKSSNGLISYFKNKNMITVLEVALLIAIIIVPLIPAKSAKVK